MTRPLTDRERCQALEARVAELEEELAAWRAEGLDAARDDALMHRAVSLRDQLQRGDRRCAMVACGMLIRLIDHAGNVASKQQLVDASRSVGSCWDREPALKIADVQVNFLRRGLSALGFPGMIETVWGYGYRISGANAMVLKAALEPERG
jgi:DNA-binding winged helix-turn-helix (wHTH) protein